MGRVEDWMSEAKWAVSAANAQPWAVAAQSGENEIAFELSVKPEIRSVTSPMDPAGAASVLALGALAECLEQIALRDGFALAEPIFRDGARLEDGTIRLHFLKKSTAELPNFAKAIVKRQTHRENFKRKFLSTEHSRIPYLAPNASEIGIKEFDGKRKQLIQSIAPLETIRCQNPYLFSFLLDEIIFSNKGQRKTGLLPETLAVSPMSMLFLRLCRRFPWLQKVFLYGAQHMFVWEGLRRPLRNSSRVYFFSNSVDGVRGWFELGKFLQHTWLRFADAGVVAQPIGLTFLAYANSKGTADSFSPDERVASQAVRHYMREHFGIELNRPGIMLRVGYSSRVVVASPRAEIPVEMRSDLLASFDFRTQSSAQKLV